MTLHVGILSGMQRITAEESSRRARAAWAYSMLSQEEFSNKTEIPLGTLSRLLSRNGTAAASKQQLYAMADAANFPRAFMDTGNIGERIELDELVTRVDSHDQLLNQTFQRVQELQEKTIHLEQEMWNMTRKPNPVPLPPPGKLRTILEGRETKKQGLDHDDNPKRKLGAS